MNIIISNRCYLSPITIDDKDDLIKHLQDKWVYETTLTVPYPYTETHALKWIKDHEDSKNEFAILNATSHFIGNIGIHPSKAQAHIGVLGYWLAKPYWGKGIMTEVVSTFTDFAFKEFNFDRIMAHCFESNIGSARVLEKAGFKYEGLMIKHYKKDGIFHNGKMYGKVI